MKTNKHISRRAFLQSGVALTAGVALPATVRINRVHAASKGRVVILGFDGVEPSIVREMMERGELPNLAKLQQGGAFKELGSTIPPQSPVAWTSFTTCKNPGGHNIFDFIRRNPKGPAGPLPYIGTGKFEPLRLGLTGALEKAPVATAFRKGRSFWSVGDEQDLRCRILNVPFVYPPDPLRRGSMLCGLGVPDVRGTTSTFTLFSNSFAPEQLREKLSGGRNQLLPLDGQDAAEVEVEGPRDVRYRYEESTAYAKTKIQFSFDRKSGMGKAGADGKSVDLVLGQWSEWCELDFKMSEQCHVRAITRFFPLEIGEHVRVYMACVQFHPAYPYAPFSSPPEYTKELYDRYGLFKTVGWSFDTHALSQGALNEDAFLMDVEKSMAWNETLTQMELDRGDFDILISVWTATDRVGHMFWRYRDPKHPLYDEAGAAKYGKALEHTYKTADGIVGRVMTKLNEGDLLMVLSDHGFESWRTGFQLNTWLEEQGYLKVADKPKAADGFLQGIDWKNTKAYSVGLSSLYLNLQGRETGGAVAPADAARVLNELRDKLLQVIDPSTSQKVFSALYTRDSYKGEAVAEAPDISLGYSRYYQSAKSAARGAVGDSAFQPNDDKWSGEHAAADIAWCPGILFANRRIESNTPNILDLGVTALRYLGRDVPSDFEGVDLISG